MAEFYSQLQFLDYKLENINLNRLDHKIDDSVFDFSPSIAVNEENSVGGLHIKFIVQHNDIELRGECTGYFSFDESLITADVEYLISHNGLTILFPYLRAAITNFTVAANLEPLIIPTINIIELMRDKYSQDENSKEDISQ